MLAELYIFSNSQKLESVHLRRESQKWV